MKNEPRAFTSRCTTLSNVLVSKEIWIVNSLDRSKRTSVVGIWDTGATNSCISSDVANKLNLQSLGFINVNTAGGMVSKKRYIVDVGLPNRIMVTDLSVTEADLMDCDVLIGMDIIGMGDFTISNCNNRTMFSFRIPSMAETDYVKNVHGIQAKSSKVGRNDSCPCGSGKKYKNCHGK